MQKVTDLFVVLCVTALWLFLSDIASDTPSTLVNYYFGDHTSITHGRITRSRVQRKSHSREYDIKYSHSVNGRFYTSDQVNFLANTRARASNTVARYPIGKEVTVYYDKLYPMLSTLEVTRLGYQVWIAGIATIMMIMISIYFALAIKQTHERRNEGIAL